MICGTRDQQTLNQRFPELCLTFVGTFWNTSSKYHGTIGNMPPKFKNKIYATVVRCSTHAHLWLNMQDNSRGENVPNVRCLHKIKSHPNSAYSKTGSFKFKIKSTLQQKRQTYPKTHLGWSSATTTAIRANAVRKERNCKHEIHNGIN